jgi:Leucine-rich repeat (LRR) protein
MDLVLFGLLLMTSNCFSLECELYEWSGYMRQPYFFCAIDRVDDDSLITFGREIEKHDNLMVTFRSLETESFPRNFDDNMKQLTSLSVVEGNLKYLEASDFHQFPKMKVLSISNCPIDEIKDPKLFHGNLNLHSITLRNLGLNVINRNVFERLKKLLNVELSGNKCINSRFGDNQENKIDKLKSALIVECLGFDEVFCEGNYDTEENRKNCYCYSRKTHANGKLYYTKECNLETDKDVREVEMLYYNESHFPQFSSNSHMFKSLINVKVSGTIDRIIFTDFYQISKVKILDLSQNFIEEIMSNTFEYTPDIEVLDFSFNRLFAIGVMTFTHLNNLKSVDLTGNLQCTTFTMFSKDELIMLNSNKIENSCKYRNALEKCLFVEESFSYIGDAYTCVVSNPNVLYQTVAFSFANATKPVQCFFVRNTKCQFLPMLISIYIKAIHITHAQLQFIQDNNLNGVFYLRSLVLSNNEITTIPSHLFSFNPDLVHLDLSNNRIAFLRTFEDFEASPLLSVSFENNLCVDEDYGYESLIKSKNHKFIIYCENPKLLEKVKNSKFIMQCQYKDNDTCNVSEISYDTSYYYYTTLDDVHVDKLNYPSQNFTRLVISNVSLSHIPDRLEEFFPNLEELTIVGTNLQALNLRVIKKLHNLKLLNVSHNMLSWFFWNCVTFDSKLTTVDLSYNNLQHIELELPRKIENFHFVTENCPKASTNFVPRDVDRNEYLINVWMDCKPAET